MARGRARKKAARVPVDVVMPTAERMAHAGRDFLRGDTGTITLRDSPFERLEARGVLTDRQVTAGTKYRTHWHRGGLQAHFSAVRMDGVFGGEGLKGLPSSEVALHHREQYRVAVQDLGVKLSLVVEDICCREIEPADVGRKLGWNSDPQGRAVATELLKEGLDRLCKLWGVT
jgi:hypothetical protein